MFTMFGGLRGVVLGFITTYPILTLDMLTSQIRHNLQVKRAVYRAGVMSQESQQYLELNKGCKSRTLSV